MLLRILLCTVEFSQYLRHYPKLLRRGWIVKESPSTEAYDISY